MSAYLGVDIGSVSSNFVLLDEKKRVLNKAYIRTRGNPIKALKQGFQSISQSLKKVKITALGTTGSGRHLAAVLLGADVVKNEITSHAVAAITAFPKIKTIIEIGGQDSKIILLKDGIVNDFAMNTVCAAGTGSFLDQQASRLNIAIEDFGDIALKSKQAVRIAGRCGVFAESDMIHKQQMAYPLEDIIMGLCEALVRNYMNNVAKGKKIEAPIAFQGGVAANAGIREAFKNVLGVEVATPKNYDVMGAIGAAILAKEYIEESGKKTLYKGYNFVSEGNFQSSSIECQDCPNLCEVVCIKRNDEILTYWGDRCKKWENRIGKELADRIVV